MKLGEIMTRDVQVVAPGDTIQRAAKLMDDLNVGALPVCDGDQLHGMITDRDITVRATSAGLGPDTKVEMAMTAEMEFLFEDDDVEAAAERMAQRQIRRLPVVDRNRKLVGIVSLGDLAVDSRDDHLAQDALEAVSEPAEPDR